MAMSLELLMSACADIRHAAEILKDDEGYTPEHTITVMLQRQAMVMRQLTDWHNNYILVKR